jgi:hypothetical protein
LKNGGSSLDTPLMMGAWCFSQGRLGTHDRAENLGHVLVVPRMVRNRFGLESR